MAPLAYSAVFLTSLLELSTAFPVPWGSWWPKHNGKSSGGINVQLGPRPYYLVDNMDEGALKDSLESCYEDEKSTSTFSIAHRGAPLMFPEHSREGYMAAGRMGAGLLQLSFSNRVESNQLQALSSVMCHSRATLNSSVVTPTAIYTTLRISSRAQSWQLNAPSLSLRMIQILAKKRALCAAPRTSPLRNSSPSARRWKQLRMMQ